MMKKLIEEISDRIIDDLGESVYYRVEDEILDLKENDDFTEEQLEELQDAIMEAVNNRIR